MWLTSFVCGGGIAAGFAIDNHVGAAATGFLGTLWIVIATTKAVFAMIGKIVNSIGRDTLE